MLPPVEKHDLGFLDHGVNQSDAVTVLHLQPAFYVDQFGILKDWLNKT